MIINRLQIGHARLTHSYLLAGDAQPTCSTYGYPLTVRHILVDCLDLQYIRQRHFCAIRLSVTYSKVLTVVPLLILSKKPVFIVYYSIHFHILA